MRKVTFSTCILILLMLTSLQKASAEYTVLNGSKHNVWVIVSTWMESERDIPAGYRTEGYYEINPGDFLSIDRVTMIIISVWIVLPDSLDQVTLQQEVITTFG